jgi:DNA-binding response OmpR family regulator
MEARPYRVLYIEDQPDAIELVRLALRRIGCEVIGVTDGLQGLNLMRSMRPDLVLLDLMLPGWDGWQVREAMQADNSLRRMPVVLVTARVTTHDPVNGRQPPPADAYITKPYSLSEIRNTVQAVLGAQVAPFPVS